MEHQTNKPNIEEILARVRAETKPDATNQQAAENGRIRQGLGPVPLIRKPDDSEAIPLGKPFYTIEEFASLDDEDFLLNAYRVILGRDIDQTGRQDYLPALRQGRLSVIRILSSLSRSGEGQARGIKIRWLKPAMILDRLGALPVVGRFFEPFMRFIVRSTTNSRLAVLATRQQDTILEINTTLTAIRKNLAKLDARLVATEQGVAGGNETSVNALSETRAVRHEISAQRSALAQVIDAAKGHFPEEKQKVVQDLEDVSLDSLYVAFENKFRGSTAEISRRSERYLPIFKENVPVAAGHAVLDIGCGRGEFLSLLKANNIVTRGIDLNGAMVAEAQALGHDVVEGDAIAYLRSLPDNSLAAITGFHIVEHIDFKNLVALFDEAFRVLMQDGVVLFETPNPQNLVVGACTFNLDPTHNKPLPPDYLQFIAEARGFEQARIIRTDQDCLLDQPESGFEATEVNDWFRQPADYAVYAQKKRSDGQA